MLGLRRFVAGVVENAVVEDLAVLINLDERRAFVSGGAFERLGEMVDVNIDRARYEGDVRKDQLLSRTRGIDAVLKNNNLDAILTPRLQRPSLIIAQRQSLQTREEPHDVVGRPAPRQPVLRRVATH